MLPSRAQAKGCSCSARCPLPQPLLGDATRLQQALLNYAANAVKFTPHGQVVLRVLAEDERRRGCCLRFEVQDTGIGIAPETLARLFRPSSRPTTPPRAAWRHRPGPGHHAPAGAADGRRRRRQQHAGAGQPVLVHGAADKGGTAPGTQMPQVDGLEATRRTRHGAAEAQLQRVHAGRRVLLRTCASGRLPLSWRSMPSLSALRSASTSSTWP
jgi:hypothetical protein